jgi:hypothetical protein
MRLGSSTARFPGLRLYLVYMSMHSCMAHDMYCTVLLPQPRAIFFSAHFSGFPRMSRAPCSDGALQIGSNGGPIRMPHMHVHGSEKLHTYSQILGRTNCMNHPSTRGMPHSLSSSLTLTWTSVDSPSSTPPRLVIAALKIDSRAVAARTPQLIIFEPQY